MSRYFPTSLIAIAGVLAIEIAASYPAAAQQMGRNGYSFPARNASLAAQFQFQRRQLNGSGAASSAAGMAAFQQYVNTYNEIYNSTSTAIGNMNTVTQNLAEGATGTVGQTTDQQSTGNQGSDASTDVTVENAVTVNEASESTDTSGNSEETPDDTTAN